MKFLDELEKLNLPRDKFAIFGSGPLAVRGIRETNDLDIIVKPDLWEELKKKYPVTSEEKGLMVIGNIEIYSKWGGWFSDLAQLIEEADIIQGLRFVKLERVLEWKKKFNREKDKIDVDLIYEYLKNKNNNINEIKKVSNDALPLAITIARKKINRIENKTKYFLILLIL